MTEERAKRKLSAILSADVKGYSRLMGEDEIATVRTLETYRERITEIVRKYNGRVVDSPGDNMLAEFASVVDAVESAVEIQKELKAKNEGLTESRRMEFRIGINLGDVIEEGERIYGDGINIAARIEGLAEAGGVCVSRNVYDQVKNKLNLEYGDLGEHAVKNISEPVRVYRIIMEAEINVPESGREHRMPGKPSIAVLPFVNMSGDPEQEYFSDGITEDIITDLSKISGLFVIARNSVFTYKGRAVKIKEVGPELGVRYVSEGSVRKANNRVRITAQLIDATTEGHLWAERYDRDLNDIFALQDEVTEKIVSFLAVKLTSEEQLLREDTAKHTNNIDAYDYYLKGLELLYRFTEETNKQSREMFEKSINLDPNYAQAYAMLGDSYLMEWTFGWSQDPQMFEKARKWSKAAIDLDDSVPEAHSVLGEIHLWGREHEQAIAEFEKATFLAPNDANLIAGLGSMKTWSGEAEEGIDLLMKAMRLNPVYPAYYLFFLGQAYYLERQYDKAIDAFERAFHLNPDWFPSHIYLSACYAELDRIEDAQAAVAQVMKAQPTFSIEHWRMHVPYKNQADVDRWINALRKAGLK
ncbi:tetratricopeptide repeat protein [Thermodesulfobacteriota bacterium]